MAHHSNPAPLAEADGTLCGRIWLSWEKHRRSEALSAALGARYLPLLSSSARPIRYCVLSVRTVRALIQFKPRTVFAQNPSIILAFMLCILRPFFSYSLIIDRHSNFELDSRKSRSAKWKLFHCLSLFTNRTADLTIVTNNYLKEVVESDGGRAFVLQDKIPCLDSSGKSLGLRRPCAAVVCTYSPDEPIDELLCAAQLLTSPVHLYVTGKPRLSIHQRRLLANVAGRVFLTNFLTEQEYASLIRDVDFVVVLTTQEHTLVCGAYEALACSKPLVLSDTRTIRDYFRYGALYCNPRSPASIARAIDDIWGSIGRFQSDAIAQREWMQMDWTGRFEALQKCLSDRCLTREQS